MKNHKTLRQALVLSCLSLASLTSSLNAGTGGSFDANDDLTLHVYFTYEEDEAKFTEDTSAWQKYFIEASKAYYDTFEGKSKIKKIYIYNNLPEGKFDFNTLNIYFTDLNGDILVKSNIYTK